MEEALREALVAERAAQQKSQIVRQNLAGAHRARDLALQRRQAAVAAAAEGGAAAVAEFTEIKSALQSADDAIQIFTEGLAVADQAAAAAAHRVHTVLRAELGRRAQHCEQAYKEAEEAVDRAATARMVASESLAAAQRLLNIGGNALRGIFVQEIRDATGP